MKVDEQAIVRLMFLGWHKAVPNPQGTLVWAISKIVSSQVQVIFGRHVRDLAEADTATDIWTGDQLLAAMQGWNPDTSPDMARDSDRWKTWPLITWEDMMHKARALAAGISYMNAGEAQLLMDWLVLTRAVGPDADTVVQP